MEMSSDMNVLDGFVPEGEGPLEKVEVENVAASRVLRALWLKGFRAGQRKLCRAGKLRSHVVRTMIPANRGLLLFQEKTSFRHRPSWDDPWAV